MKIANLVSNIKNQEKRSATLLELFFDLIIVALIGKAASNIVLDFNDDKGWMLILTNLITILMTLSIWRSTMIFQTRFHQSSARYKVMMFSIMFPILLMIAGVYMPIKKDGIINDVDVFNKGIIFFTGYILTSVTSIVLLMSLLWFGLIKKHAKREVKLLAFLSILPKLISAAGGIAYLVLMTGVFKNDFQSLKMSWLVLTGVPQILLVIFDFITIWFTPRHSRVRFKRELFKERMAIIVIIFLGEVFVTLLSVEYGHNGSNITEIIGYLLVSIPMVFGWWWTFNDMLNFTDLKRKNFSIAVYLTLMPFLMISILMMAVGIAVAFDTSDPTAFKGMLIFSVALSSFSLAFTIIYFVCFKIYNRKLNYVRPPWMKFLIITGALMPAIYILLAFVYPNIYLCVGLTTASAYGWLFSKDYLSRKFPATITVDEASAKDKLKEDW